MFYHFAAIPTAFGAPSEERLALLVEVPLGVDPSKDKIRIMNDFWVHLGLSVIDAVYTMEPHVLNEFGNTWEFVVYGEEQCA